MCSNPPPPSHSSATTAAAAAAAMLPYAALKVPNPGSALSHFHTAAAMSLNPASAMSLNPAALEFHRAQLYDYNRALQYGLRAYPTPHGLAYHPHPADPLAHAFFHGKFDPRARFIHEEPKPSHSYIGLIAMAILSHKDKKLVLSDIYQWILDNYNYFRTRGPGWRNSIRHNLSLNDCFIKSGRSANGKGHYWAIHPANVEDFKRGDFRRRRAQRKVRKHMGLAVPDDEDSPSPPPNTSVPLDWQSKVILENIKRQDEAEKEAEREAERRSASPGAVGKASAPAVAAPSTTGRKRLFDMESLLAPEPKSRHIVKQEDEEDEEDIVDIVSAIKEEDEDCDEREVVDVEDPRDLTVSGKLRSEPPSPAALSPAISTATPTTSPAARSDTGSPVTISPSASSPVDERRPAWTSPGGGLPGTPGWGEHPSAFHSTVPPSGHPASWPSLPPHAFPLLSSPYPLSAGPTGAVMSPDAAQRWHQTFSRLMARSYDKNLKLEV